VLTIGLVVMIMFIFLSPFSTLRLSPLSPIPISLLERWQYVFTGI